MMRTTLSPRPLPFPCLVEAAVERPHVHYHLRDVGAIGEVVYLAQVARVVNEPPDALAVLLEEVPLRDLRGLGHALAGGNRRRDDDELD